MLKGSRYANAIVGIVRHVKNDRSRALLYVTVNPLEHFKFDHSQHAPAVTWRRALKKMGVEYLPFQGGDFDPSTANRWRFRGIKSGEKKRT